MKLDDLRSIDQLRDFLEGTQDVVFAVLTGKDERYRWMQQTLIKFRYRHLSKADKGIVIRYLMKMSGYSRQQATRLIGQYIDCGQLRRRQCTVRGFQRRYTDEDVALLVEVDCLHDTANGLAVKKLCERAWRVHGDLRYRRLAQISVSHIYNLRKSKGYMSRRRAHVKTRAHKVRIGERRKPQPKGHPGYLRVDTVHQGDWDGHKGVYHINAVDQVTQFEAVVSVEQISERYLIPAPLIHLHLCKQTRSVIIHIPVQMPLMELVQLRRTLPRNMCVSEQLPHHMPFLHSTSALSLLCRVRDLVNSMRSFSSSSDTR